jgi:hypothetical protein
MGNLLPTRAQRAHMKTFQGQTVTIVTACDEAYAPLMFGLWESLEGWRDAFALIDIGLAEETRNDARKRGIRVINLQMNSFVKRPWRDPIFARCICALRCLNCSIQT